MITFVIGSFFAILLTLFCCAFFIQVALTVLPFLKKGLILCAALVAIVFVIGSITPKTAPKAQSAPTVTASDGSVLVKLD